MWARFVAIFLFGEVPPWYSLLLYYIRITVLPQCGRAVLGRYFSPALQDEYRMRLEVIRARALNQPVPSEFSTASTTASPSLGAADRNTTETKPDRGIIGPEHTGGYRNNEGRAGNRVGARARAGARAVTRVGARAGARAGPTCWGLEVP